MLDSLPSFGLLHPPQISLLNPLRNASGPGSCFSPEFDSDDDASPPATPPISAPQSRRPSLAAPPFPRRASDPSKGGGSGSGNGRGAGAASSDPLERMYGNVIQMGGYRGSILRDAKTNKRLWIPLKVGFGLRKADLGLGLEDEDELNSEERIVAGHFLSQISGWIDLGRKLKDRFKQISATQHAAPRDPLRPPLRYHSFGYDWRRSLQMSSKLLLEMLIRLKEESALRGEGPDGQGLGATIIAHSVRLASHADSTCARILTPVRLSCRWAVSSRCTRSPPHPTRPSSAASSSPGRPSRAASTRSARSSSAAESRSTPRLARPPPLSVRLPCFSRLRHAELDLTIELVHSLAIGFLLPPSTPRTCRATTGRRRATRAAPRCRRPVDRLLSVRLFHPRARAVGTDDDALTRDLSKCR